MPKQRMNIVPAGEHGVIYDVQPYNLPPNAWSNGNNYKIKDGSAITVRGRLETTVDPIVQPQHLLPLQDNASDYWLYAGFDNTLVDAQDETDYDGAGSNGSFIGGDGAGGTAYVVSDVITLVGGITLTVDAIDANDDVTDFTITDVSNASPEVGTAVTQLTTDATILIATQDETDYDSTGTNGTFMAGDGAGGTAYAAAEVITLSNGGTITVDAIEPNGNVLEFTVTTAGSSVTPNVALTQTSSDGSGLGFTLTPKAANVEGGTGFSLTPGTNNVNAQAVLCTLSSAGNHTDISPVSPLTGSGVARWSSTNYGGFSLVTNNEDAPHSWDGAAANAVSLANWPASTLARVIESYKGFIVVGNVTKSGANEPRLVKWSNQSTPGALPTSWDETDPTVTAGEFELTAEGGAIVDLLELNDTLYIYRETGVDSMTFTGGTLVFNFRQLFRGFGTIAPNCVTSLKRKHYVFSNQDLVMHDGVTYTSIVEGKTRKKIFDNIDGVFKYKCFVTTNNNENEVWFCYPQTGFTTCNKAYTYNVLTGEHGERDILNLEHAAAGRRLDFGGSDWDSAVGTWDDNDQRWNQNQTVGLTNVLSVSAVDKKFYHEDFGFTDNGNDIESFVERINIPITGLPPMTTVTITDVFPILETKNVISTTKNNVLIGNKHTTQGGLIWKTFDFDPVTDYKLSCRATGKLPSFRFYWKGKGQLRVQGYSFDYVLRGVR